MRPTSYTSKQGLERVNIGGLVGVDKGNKTEFILHTHWQPFQVVGYEHSENPQLLWTSWKDCRIKTKAVVSAGEMWDQWDIFYVCGHTSRNLASKAPKFSMKMNHLRLYVNTKNQQGFNLRSRWKFDCKNIFLAHWSHTNELLVWDLWTPCKDPVIFRCNTANFSKSRYFNKQWDFSLQHILCNVRKCSGNM